MSYTTQLKNIVKTHSKVTYYHTLFCLLLAAISAVGLLIDDRTLTGVNVWLKPLKFSVSTAIYIFSVGYFTHLYNYGKTKKAIINHITSWTLSIELSIIVMQGARGVLSHYNMSSPLDGILYAIMGIFIGINVMIMVLFFIDTMRRKPDVSYTMLGALLVGWFSILYGSYVGGQMIAQLSHNVGVADGGSGLPLVNWSLNGGDLRVAHFFGIHGIQVIPGVAYLLTRKWVNVPTRAAIATTVFALAYVGLIALTFYQAKQGMPLIALTLS